MLRRVAQGQSEVTNAEPGQGALHAVDKPRAFLDQALALPIGPLGVLFGNSLARAPCCSGPVRHATTLGTRASATSTLSSDKHRDMQPLADDGNLHRASGP